MSINELYELLKYYPSGEVRNKLVEQFLNETKTTIYPDKGA